jgi:hypothetical protein
MKKIYSSLSLIVIGLAAHAQVFWTENFGTGCNRGQAASAYSGTNGSWTNASTGTNGNVANDWFISATCSNTGAGNCSDNCSINAANTNATLHVSNGSIVIPAFYTVNADTGASYFSGGFSSFGYVATTNRRMQSPVINCTGHNNITVSFIYLENGDASNDDGQLVYSADGGTTWTSINALAKTTGSCSYGQWTLFSMSLPASANNNANVKIGFTWVNNDDATGTDPSFAVDDITLTDGGLGIATAQVSALNLFASGNGQVTITPNGNSYKVIGIYDMLGQNVKFNQAENTISLAESTPGIYIMNLEVNGVRMVKKISMN